MKVGVLGLGSIGMRHARNLKMMGHKAIGYDTDMKKRLALDGVLYERDEVVELSDAIVIATPTIQHYSDIIDCLKKEKPLFVEKPLTHRTFDGTSWGPALSSLPLRDIFVGYMLRMHPCVKAAKNWIDAGNIGKPLWATFTCGQFNDKPDYLRDGVVLNWSHEIDLALYLLGPAKVVAASVATSFDVPWGEEKGNDNIADFVLQHENGARSTIHLDYVTKNEIREGWIVGTEKNIGLDMLGRQVSFGKMAQQFGGQWNDDYMDEMADFIKLSGPEGVDFVSPMANGEDGLRVLEICQQVKEKAGLG